MSLRINGIGFTFLGVSAQDEQNRATATKWFTFLYLPVLPLQRLYVQFLPHEGTGFSYQVLGQTPLNWKEIALTYFWGSLVMPVSLIGPLFLGVTEIWLPLGLPPAGQLPYILFCCLWLGVGAWKLADRQEAQCQPRFPRSNS